MPSGFLEPLGERQTDPGAWFLLIAQTLLGELHEGSGEVLHDLPV